MNFFSREGVAERGNELNVVPCQGGRRRGMELLEEEGCRGQYREGAAEKMGLHVSYGVQEMWEDGRSIQPCK